MGHSSLLTIIQVFGAVKALAMSSRIGDVGGDAVNPLQGIERKQSGAGARVRGCFQGQAAVFEFLQGVHGEGGTGDVAGLRLQ